MNPDKYTYRVTWSEEDREYVGLCVEFPSLSWVAKSQTAALKGIRKVVADAVRDMKKNQEPCPDPIATKRCSGKFVVRVPPEVHRQLILQAEESHVSLNRYVSYRLSQ